MPQSDHSLPQVLLRGFSMHGRGKEAVLYRKSQPGPAVVKIKSSFCALDQFIDPDGTLDALHQRYENDIGPVLKKLRKGGTPDGTTFESLVRFASHLFLRAPSIHSRLEAMFNAAIASFAGGLGANRVHVLTAASREAAAAAAHQRLYDREDRLFDSTAEWASQLDAPRIVAAPEGRFWVTGDMPVLPSQSGPPVSHFFWFPFSATLGFLAGNPPVSDELALAELLNFLVVTTCFDSVIADRVDAELAELVRLAGRYRIGYEATARDVGHDSLGSA